MAFHFQIDLLGINFNSIKYYYWYTRVINLCVYLLQ